MQKNLQKLVQFTKKKNIFEKHKKNSYLANLFAFCADN